MITKIRIAVKNQQSPYKGNIIGMNDLKESSRNFIEESTIIYVINAIAIKF